MQISRLSVQRPVTILMISLIVILMGVISLTRIPIDLYPNIEIPIAIVSTDYDGAGPQEIENLVTKPIEDVSGTIQNIKSIRSISSEGNSLVILEFAFNTDMNFAALDVREKLDLISALLPDGSSKPMVLKIDPNSLPILELSITSASYKEAQWLVENELVHRLERIPGVAAVQISGESSQEIQVTIKEAMLQHYGLNISQIAQQLRSENLNLPGGSVSYGDTTLSVRSLGAFDEISDIEEMPLIVTNSSGLPESVRLKDVATIQLVEKEVQTITKTNGKESLTISIQKQSGTNTVQVADSILAEVANLQRDFKTLNIVVAQDQAEFIRASIDNVTRSAVIGALFAIAILYLFLRNIRTTLIIGISIPVSIIATFILLFYQGITLNLMTLGGLALGIGMLVDNAIVVLENIYRFRTMGYSRTEAAIEGTKEVAMAVTASTLTTIAVFLPISFVEGITATIFRELALTVTFSLSTSLIVSLTLVPMMSSKLLKIDDFMGKEHHGRSKLFDWFYNSFDRMFSKIDLAYKRTLKFALSHRLLTVLISLGIFGSSLLSIFVTGTEYFPSLDQGEFTVSIELPNGSELQATEKIVNQLTDEIKSYSQVSEIYETIGSNGNRFLSSPTKNTARLRVVLKSIQEQTRATQDIADEVRQWVKNVPGAKFRVSVTSMGFGGMSSAPVSVAVKGNDLVVLERVSADIVDLLQEIPGTREIENSSASGNEEILVHLSKEKIAYFGLSGYEIANQIKTALTGQRVTSLKIDGKEFNVVLKREDQFSSNLHSFKQLPIKSPYGSVPLDDVAKVVLARGPSVINREEQSRVVTVTAQLLNRDLGAVIEDLEKALETYALPPDYAIVIGGESADMEAAFKDLRLALILAIVIVYMVMAAQFESLIHPFTILLTIPLSFSGALLALWISGQTLSVPSFIGMIMLAGIVVNNAIVLVDYINTRRAQGESLNEAITSAGPIRLRPILMTTLTTILGLLPLSLGIGEGSEAQAPLATAVIGGLTLSTLLTLVLIPVVYSYFEQLRGFFNRKSSVEGVHNDN